MEKRILDLQTKIKEIESFFDNNKLVQIPVPIGPLTQGMLNRDMLVFTGRTSKVNLSFNSWIEVLLDGTLYWVGAKLS